MPLEYSRPPAPAASSLHPSRQAGLLLLRLAAGGGLLYWHARPQLPAAWSRIWDKTPWELPGQLTALGFPFGFPLALALVILVTLGAFFLILGLLTRLSALPLALITGTTGLLYHNFPATAETAALFCGICTAIFLCGPGTFALDPLLSAATRRS